MSEEKVFLQSVLEALKLFWSLLVVRRGPVVVGIGARFQRLGRDRRPSGEIVLSRV
jgi:hypothetical protein